MITKTVYLITGSFGSKIVDALSTNIIDNAEHSGGDVFKITAELYEPTSSFLKQIIINVTKHDYVRQSVWREVDGN